MATNGLAKKAALVPERDKGVHVRREVTDGAEKPGVERPPGPELDGDGQRHPEPGGADVEHRQAHDDRREDHRDAGPDHEIAQLGVLLADLLGLRENPWDRRKPATSTP
jgi:hypothetical protein